MRKPVKVGKKLVARMSGEKTYHLADCPMSLIH